MPLPLLFIVPAVLTGTVGLGSAVKAGVDTASAKAMNQNANEIVQNAADRLNRSREATGRALRVLGESKLSVLNGSMRPFLDTFTRIKNVDFRDSVGLDELSKLHIDEKDFQEMRSMVNYAGSVLGGLTAGSAGGALVAFGAYSAAQVLATASTGTAIAALHGAAATNATLAFFGGGSLAAGGLGVAGGTAVLGGLVAGPALLVLGLVVGGAARKGLVQAKANQAEAASMAAEMDTGVLQCQAIRRRTYMLYNLLVRLDARFTPLIYRLEDIVSQEGEDYRQYCPGSKAAVASCASLAVTIKSLLDTPLLTDDGLLTPESESAVSLASDKLRPSA